MRDSLLSDQILANVRFAARALERVALSAIPNLDEVAPPTRKTWSNNQYENWVARALARAKEAIDWRDRVQAKIGSIDTPNQCKADPTVTHETLRSELGYSRVRRKHDKDGTWTGEYEPDPNWGPPESLLGEFEVRVPDGEEESSKYVPGSHPILWLGNARTYLGPPPDHLTRPPFFSKISAEMYFSLYPSDWDEYSGIIIEQCLLVRTRAIELCSWCKQRLAAWEAAYYPLIKIGPDRKNARTRTLRVFMSDAEVALPRNTIPCGDAIRLLSLKGGSEVDFDHRAYKDELLKLIPPLRGHLQTVVATNTTPKTGGRYCIPQGLRIDVETE